MTGIDFPEIISVLKKKDKLYFFNALKWRMLVHREFTRLYNSDVFGKGIFKSGLK